MRQRGMTGYSLLELTLVIAAAGMVAVVGMTLLQQRAEHQRTVSHSALMTAAEQAVVGFVYARNRLPCPAGDESGIEDCTVTTGWFPHRSVGMAEAPRNSAGHALRYAYYSAPSVNAATDADLAVLRDRFRPYYAATAPAIGAPRVMGTTNGLDFCQALTIAGSRAPSTAHLHVLDEDGAGGYQPAAFVLINPGSRDADGDGSMLDGRNAALSEGNPAADSPSRAAGNRYDDRVHAVYFNQLSQTLDCANVMAPTGAHANAVTAATVMEQVIADYQEQLEAMELMAQADLVTGSGDILSSAVDTAATTAEASTSVASSINTYGALAAAIAASAVAIGLAVTALAVSIGGEVVAGLNLDAVQSEIDAFQSQRAEVVIHKNRMESNLIRIDAGGLYE